MQLGIRAKFLISFGLLIIIIISNFGFIVAVENNASKQDQWVMLAHKVIAESDHLLTRLIDTETGQRGFLLTHDDAYLAPYNTGLTETIKSLAALKSLTKNNPTQQFRLNRIEELINKKKDELNDTISLSIQGQKDKALAIVQSDVGKTIMDSLRLHIEEFKAIEHDLLQIRRAQYVKDQNFVYSLFITEALLLIFLIVILGYKIQTSVVTPLIKLASYAKKLGAGAEVKELSIINDDEIGKLVKAFNKMRESVRSRTEALKLQAHYDQSFSQAVTSCSSNYDLSQAISDALLSHSNWHPSPLSALYLFNEKTKELDCVVSHGTSDEAKKSMSSTSGLVGQAYNANEAMVVSADAVEGFYIDIGIGSIAPKAVILQPINYNNKVLGVLILAYTSTPTDRDLQYIENLTYQFGITIVAARRYEALQVLTEEAVEKSITDSLTGLRNRGFIQIELDRQISVSHRYNQDLALILIDIDHFKKINDTRGHQVGDQALITLANVLLKNTRASDLVVRYGGEEFIVLLPQSSLNEVKKASEKLRKAVENTKVPILNGNNMTISLGVSMLVRGDTSDTFINRADKALYRAKNDGRNLVRMDKAYERSTS